jgi:hypothetical protein
MNVEVPIHQTRLNELAIDEKDNWNDILGEFDERSTNYILAPWKLPFIIHSCNVAMPEITRWLDIVLYL